METNKKNNTNGSPKNVDSAKSKKEVTVGIVRPISSFDDVRNFNHWENIHKIIEEALSQHEEYDFKISLVSDTSSADVIQNTIIKNLFNSDVIICDMSSLNANVFFELGVRMAYQKPCVLLIDDKSKAPFDISAIKYIQYPSSLHYYQVQKVKNDILESVVQVYSQFIQNNIVSYSSYFTDVNIKEPAEMKTKEVSGMEAKLDMVLDKLKKVETQKIHQKKMSKLDSDKNLSMANNKILWEYFYNINNEILENETIK